MGFSVSGSFAILILATFIAFGMFYTAGANSFERVSDATTSTYEDDLDRQNTAINITELTYQGSHLDVNVTNEGTTTLSVNDTDVVVDNVYYAPGDAQYFRVAGDPNTGLWEPGETLFVRIQLSGGETPARAKVVTEYGVADGGAV